MEVGLFQLENLMHSNVQFCFLDLRAVASEVPSQLSAILARAVKVGAEKVESYLKQKIPGKDLPVILLSEDGRSAQNLAEKLERAGYTNIYVVEGGVAGLVSEL